MRPPAGDAFRLFESQRSTAWTVLFEADGTFNPTGPSRFVRVLGIDDLEQLPSFLESARPHLQTAGLAISSCRLAEIGPKLSRIGVTRICPIGQMQHPPASWRHDGRPALLDLLGWVDTEPEQNQ